MAKLKLAILIILATLLAVFAYENSSPSPALTLFKHQLVVIPTYLLAYASLALGLLIGWIAHGLRFRRKRRQAQVAQAASDQQRQEPQAGQANNQAQ